MSNLPPPPPFGSQQPPSYPQYGAGGGYPGSAPPPPYGGPPRGSVPASLSGVYYNKGLNVLLTIVTCGVWGFVWSYRTFEDLKQYNGDGIGGGIGLLLAVLVSPAVMFLAPYEIEKMYQRDGRQSPVSTLLGLWFLLPIIGNFIWYFKTQDALNEFWLSKGSSPA